MNVDDLIEKTLGDPSERTWPYEHDDLRAVAEAAFHSGRATGNQEAASLQEDAAIDARRELARELLAMPGYADDVIMQLTLIAEEGE